MANTVIQLKKSATPSAAPASLANGELALNFADGKLFYKHANGTITPFNTSGGGGNAFGSVDVDGTLIVADTTSDVLSLVSGTNITLTACTVTDTITISATGTGGASVNVGNTLPSTNSQGSLWWNTELGRLFISYVDADSTQWVDASPPAVGPKGDPGSQGPPGETGEQGPPGQTGPAGNVEIGTVTTTAPNTPVSVTNSGNGSYAVLNFSIPRNNTVAVGTTTTGNPGTQASVTNGGTDSDIVLNFTVPRGNVGPQGDAGPAGPVAPKGITIPIPQANDEYTIMFTEVALTMTQIRCVTMSSFSVANATTNVSFFYGTSRNSGTAITTNFVVGNTFTGNANTTFTNSSIPANSWIWIDINATVNAPAEFHASLFFTS